MNQSLELTRLGWAGLSAKDKAALMREWTGTPAPQEPDRLLRPKVAADRLACTTRTVFNLIKSGALTRIKLPGRKRGCGVRNSEVEALNGGEK